MKEFEGKQVTIMSCSDCNTKCKHCYVSYKGNISGLKLYDMCKILKDKYVLNINGTEVLLHKDYFKTYDLIGQRRVLTNGIIIDQDDEIIDMIKDSSIEMIAMSYHFGIHDEISSVQQEMLKRNIKKLQDNGIKVELMCTLNKDNYDKVEEIAKNVIDLGVKKIRFINYLRTGNALNMSDDNCLSEEQMQIALDSIHKIREKYDKDLLLVKRCGTFENDNANGCNFQCSAGIDEVVIAPDMKVYPCIYMVKEGMDMGKYEDGKVLLDKEPDHNKTKCLARHYFNKHENFNWRENEG